MDPADLDRPWLVLVTGEPGSGKSTLGRGLATALRVPYLSRDDVRHGLVATASRRTDGLGQALPRELAVETFVHLVEQAATAGVSAVLEVIVFHAHPEVLQRLRAVADCVVVLATCDDAPARAVRRDRADALLNRGAVLNALGHASVDDYLHATEHEPDRMRASMRTDLDLPTLTVATDDGFDPPLAHVVDWIVNQTSR